MEQTFFVLVLILVFITLIAFFYIAYHIKKASGSKDPWYFMFFPKRKKVSICNAKDTKALKGYIQNAVNVIRANITLLKADDILSLAPHMLVTKYPFYIEVLKLPMYLDINQCYTPIDVNNAIKDIYGPIEKSESLHINIPGYPNYLILLDIIDAVDYYRTYRDTVKDIMRGQDL